MTDNIAPQVARKSVGEDLNGAVSLSGKLDVGELLSGTPTAVEVTTSDLTITNIVISTAILTINGESVPVGEAVQFSVSGGLSATRNYLIYVTSSTDATPAQVRDVVLRLTVFPNTPA